MLRDLRAACAGRNPPERGMDAAGQDVRFLSAQDVRAKHSKGELGGERTVGFSTPVKLPRRKIILFSMRRKTPHK